MTTAIADLTYVSEKRTERACQLEEEARNADLLVLVLRLVRGGLRRRQSIDAILGLLQEAGHGDEKRKPWTVDSLLSSMAKGQKAANEAGGTW